MTTAIVLLILVFVVPILMSRPERPWWVAEWKFWSADRDHAWHHRYKPDPWWGALPPYHSTPANEGRSVPYRGH